MLKEIINKYDEMKLTEKEKSMLLSIDDPTSVFENYVTNTKKNETKNVNDFNRYLKKHNKYIFKTTIENPRITEEEIKKLRKLFNNFHIQSYGLNCNINIDVNELKEYYSSNNFYNISEFEIANMINDCAFVDVELNNNVFYSIISDDIMSLTIEIW